MKNQRERGKQTSQLCRICDKRCPLDALVGAALPSFVILAFVVVFYLIAGCIMDILAIVVVTVPIIFPILVDGLGYDPYVLIMIAVLVSAIGAITPPIGIQVFTMSNVTRIPPERFSAVSVRLWSPNWLSSF